MFKLKIFIGILLPISLFSQISYIKKPNGGIIPPKYEQRYALVIGNNKYEYAPLRNPVNDALLLQKTLQTVGFHVDTVLNGSRDEMMTAIQKFSQKVKGVNNVALIYFSGHGMQVYDDNWLFPVDAIVKESFDVTHECISLQYIFNQLKNAKTNTNIIILDACRNNPFGYKGYQRGLTTPKSFPSGTLIAFATSPGETASQGYGINSEYVFELSREIVKPNVKIEDAFKQVRTNLKSIDQIPWENTSLVGDFYFNPKSNPSNIDTYPDSDIDGIFDKIDKCPYLFGSLKNEGCPEPYDPNWKSKYCLVRELSYGLHLVRKDFLYGFLDEQGMVNIPFIFNNASSFSEGLACVQINGKYGWIDNKGNTILPFIYDKASPFREGLASVTQNMKSGFINKSGSIQITLSYDNASSFSEGLACVEKNNKHGYIDKKGKVVIPLIYNIANSFSEGLAAVVNEGKMGFINKYGESVIPFKYDVGDGLRGLSILLNCDFSNGLACVSKGAKYGFINNIGTEVIPFIYDDAKPFSEDLAAVEQNGRSGYINTNGNLVISFMYKYAHEFKEGLASVQLNEKWGYIDKLGMVIIPFKFDRAWSFNEGIATVEQIGKGTFSINSKGEVLGFCNY